MFIYEGYLDVIFTKNKQLTQAGWLRVVTLSAICLPVS